ncbi:hypothetical protein CPSG_00741 [Coccidioides posadasii str. Silveira]|uniref:Uncharacterized protein n=1 Tax=Coccidioides posadasii (strain RMSCC 757 / Silveira) TaxID=443226 RepID=E9CT32_COCPS|nr:hypothetical protein CPSG_00741 [Coccidioides posadasii str. Silveira]
MTVIQRRSNHSRRAGRRRTMLKAVCEFVSMPASGFDVKIWILETLVSEN